MRRSSLLAVTLLVAPGVPPAADPPYLAAAKERRERVKAFEVALNIKAEWKNVAVARPDERFDCSGTGTAKLAVDGKKFWCIVDPPPLTYPGDAVVRRRIEQGFDGRTNRSREERRVEGGRAEQLNQVLWTGTPSSDWREPSSILAPLGWLFHGFDAELKRTGTDTEVVEGVPCERYTNSRFGETTTVWFDPKIGHVPRRAVRTDNDSESVTVVRYQPLAAHGWRPAEWVMTDAAKLDGSTTVTTVTVDSFDLRDSIPDARFTVAFPVGSRVTRNSEKGSEFFVVADDGSLVPEVNKPDTSLEHWRPEPPPQPPLEAPPELPSVWRALVAVGATAVAFAGLVVLLRWLGRGPKPGSNPADRGG